MSRVLHNKTIQGNCLPGQHFVLQIHQSRMNGGIPFQTSLRKDSSQAASKILSVYCIQLSSTKSQTCTSVTVGRQKAIHTPTTGTSCRGQPPRDGRKGQWEGGSEAQKKGASPEWAASCERVGRSTAHLCVERWQEIPQNKGNIPNINT